MESKTLRLKILLLLLSLCLTSCSFSKIKVSEFSIERGNWGKGEIHISYVRENILGQKKSVYPDYLEVTVKDENSDVLFEKSFNDIKNLWFEVNDKNLGSNEKLYVTVCSSFGENNICKTKVIYASPKRYYLSSDISYPDGDLFHFGMTAYLSGQRKKFGSNEYETIFDNLEPNGTVSISIEGYENSTLNLQMKNGYIHKDISLLPGFKRFFEAFKKEIKLKNSVTLNVKHVIKLGNSDIYFNLKRTINSPPNFNFDYTKSIDCRETTFELHNYTFNTLVVRCKAGYFDYQCDDKDRKVYTFKMLPWEERKISLSYGLCYKVTEGKTAAGFLGAIIGSLAGAAASDGNDTKPLAGALTGAGVGVEMQACNSGKKKVSAYCEVIDRIPFQ